MEHDPANLARRGRRRRVIGRRGHGRLRRIARLRAATAVVIIVIAVIIVVIAVPAVAGAAGLFPSATRFPLAPLTRLPLRGTTVAVVIVIVVIVAPHGSSLRGGLTLLIVAAPNFRLAATVGASAVLGNALEERHRDEGQKQNENAHRSFTCR